MSNEPGILPEPIPFGKYYLLERISVGGMAEIYKAKAFGVEGFERLLAVKKILSSIAEDESFIEMFIDEAKIAGQLNHPNIAQIFDLGKVDGSYFIALEYISGKDLKNIFERARRLGEQVDIPQVCYVVMKVCEGLAHAHNKTDSQGRELNIVHRDISPQNILISYEGEVKIIDFGIAKAQGKTSQTQVGVLKGKFSYMSPEQVRGLHVDRRSDVFSLGIVLYEMLTMERLFLGESDFDTLEKIRKVEMSPPSLYNPEIPPELEDIVLKALEKNPDDRFQSATEFAEALERFMRNEDYFYKNTDLAEFMKDAFREDIEFEKKKLEYYRGLDLQPPDQLDDDGGEEEEGGGGLEWGEEEMETQIFDRDNRPGSGAGPAPENPEGLPPEPVLPDSDIVYAGQEGEAQSPGPQPPGGEAGGGVEIVGPDNEVDYVEAEEISEGDDQAPTVEYDRWDDDEIVEEEPAPGTPGSGPEAPEGAGSPQSRRREPTAKVESRRLEEETPPPSPRPTPGGDDDDNFRKRLFVIGGTAAAFIIVALGVLFAFSGNFFESSAHIKFIPQEGQPRHVRIFINGEQIYDGNTPFSYDAKPGKAKIVVKADGYQPDKRDATLKAGKKYRFPTELTKAPPEKAEVFVKSKPPGADLSVDGEAISDPTPVTVDELEPGSHKFVVSKDGYFDATKEVEVEEGAESEIELKMNPEKVALTVESEPSGAEFKVYAGDSSEKVGEGKTPETVEELAGDQTYRVVVERWGYNDFEKTFEPGTDVEATLKAELVKEGEEEEDEEEQADDSGPTVAETGNQAGQADDSTDSTGAAGSGSGGREAETTGGDSTTTTGGSGTSGGGTGEEVANKGNDGQTSGSGSGTGSGGATGSQTGGGSGSEPKGKGTLMINSRPAAAVFINGKNVGHTPVLNYEVSAGKHTVILKNEEFGLKKTYYPKIKDGETKKIINR